MDTLLLDTQNWDLVSDLQGNIALASNPYAEAQDAASAMRLFQSELWYDTTQGVPYWQAIFGRLPPLNYIKSRLTTAALTVPGVTAVRIFIASFINRKATGQVQIFDEDGNTSTAVF